MEDYIYHEVRSLAICYEAWPVATFVSPRRNILLDFLPPSDKLATVTRQPLGVLRFLG